MTIALSSDFLLAFSNVQKGHQKQVREFIERFRERPDSPGINYEVIQSAKGKDLYSVRINQAYRAVVFHPSHHPFTCCPGWTTTTKPIVGLSEAVCSAPRHGRASSAERGGQAAHRLRLRPGLPNRSVCSGQRQTPTALRRARGADPSGARGQNRPRIEGGESRIPQEAYEALYMLASGYTLEEVFREMEKPEEEARSTKRISWPRCRTKIPAGST